MAHHRKSEPSRAALALGAAALLAFAVVGCGSESEPEPARVVMPPAKDIRDRNRIELTPDPVDLPEVTTEIPESFGDVPQNDEWEVKLSNLDPGAPTVLFSADGTPQEVIDEIEAGFSAQGWEVEGRDLNEDEDAHTLFVKKGTRLGTASTRPDRDGLTHIEINVIDLGG